jgi:hypothetical protein
MVIAAWPIVARILAAPAIAAPFGIFGQATTDAKWVAARDR